MTAKDLIKALQNLGEDNLDREVIMFDGPSWFTPYKVEILSSKDWDSKLQGKVLID